jgi:DNA (cytosine-5)-methyltransferase 1
MPEFQNLEFDLSENFFLQNFKFIDLFAGIGGFHLALEQLGGKCVFASEKDEYARKTYLTNHNIDPNFFNDDIRKVAPLEIPDHDILCAGFPCQPFSVAGKQKGFEDGDNSERGNLFFSILDILEAKRPKAFILENVRNLEKHDDGRTLQTIIQELKDLGYSIDYKILKASDFNVPQHRPRIFLVGFDLSQVNYPKTFDFPSPIPLKKTMSDIFDGKCHREVGFTLRVGGKGSGIHDRRNWDCYLVNGQEKRIGIKEGKRMMGLPEVFTFPVSNTQAMKQLGNSVCVDVVRAVATNVIKYINQNIKDESEMAGQNKGELSEAYTLLKVIHDQFIKYADKNGLPSHDSICVTTIDLKERDLKLDEHQYLISFIKDDVLHEIPISQFVSKIELEQIVNEIKGIKATSSSQILDIKKDILGIKHFKADSYKKSDLSMSFISYPENESYFKQGTSVKSHLGANPTLLNASGSTNFVYSIENLSKSDLEEICNSTQYIDEKGKKKILIKDRIQSIFQHGGRLEFLHCENPTYATSLESVDSRMDEILADALISYYNREITKLSEYRGNIISQLAAHNRLKDFIRYTMFGIFPNRTWDGTCTANGVILVEGTNGQIVFFHITKEDILKEYFFSRSYFDTASLSRHRFGQVYYENGKPCIKLNLQIRLSPNA